MMIRRRPWLILAGTGGIGLAAWSGLANALPVFCPLRRWTGIPCGSCGLTRATIAFCRGDWRLACHYHLAALPLLGLAGVAVVLSGYELCTGRDVLGPLWRHWGTVLTWIMVSLVLVGWGVNLAAYFGHPVGNF